MRHDRYSALRKVASWGDVMNGLASGMTMGNPNTPQLFSPGTNKLKPEEQRMTEQRNAAIAGAASIPFIPGVGPFVAGLGKALGACGTTMALFDALADCNQKSKSHKQYYAYRDGQTAGRRHYQNDPEHDLFGALGEHARVSRQQIGLQGPPSVVDVLDKADEIYRKRVRASERNAGNSRLWRWIAYSLQNCYGLGSLVDTYDNYKALREDGNTVARSAGLAWAYGRPWYRLAEEDDMPANSYPGTFSPANQRQKNSH